MTTISRAVARAKLAADLKEVLVGTNLPLADFYAYRVSAPVPAPLGLITSAATQQDATTANCQHTTFTYHVWLIAPYSDVHLGGTWTEEDAENALDSAEALVRNYVKNNRHLGGYWDNIEYAGPSDADLDFNGDDGLAYRAERITLNVLITG